MTPSKKVRMSCEDGVHLLVIAGAHKSDEGGYECGVKSEGGAATCAATLTVRREYTVHTATRLHGYRATGL